MNKNNRFVKIAIAVVLASMMAGSSTMTLLTAMGLPCSVALAYLPGLAAALLCAVGTLSSGLAIGAAAAAVLLGGVALGANLDAVAAVRVWLQDFAAGVTSEAETMASAGVLLAVLVSAIMGACAFLMIHRRGGTVFALVIYLAILIGSYALTESMSFCIAIPGLIAAVAAFAFSGDVPRDASGWRAVVCAVLVVAIALTLVPSGRLTWGPLEDAAQAVRDAFEDYFQFTEERVPFTISTEGYNYAIEVNGNVVSRLGGPATPDDEAVMLVTTDSDVLLRGAIRRTYTGSSWTDTDAKARYLYYDFTRKGVREQVFSMYEDELFSEVNVTVEFLTEGTSSLFVTTRLESFDMDLQSAVYYNSIGEMFLTDLVQEGDTYSLVGWQIGDEDALREAVIAAEDEDDSYYSEVAETCLQLPDGIEQGVYTLVSEITEDCDNDYDKAAAIESWLKQNCVYTLDVDYPDSDRDFVSQFVLSDREGYCSYFASAMAVMCRIAGIPARYVEGYYVKSNGSEAVTVTGENAHAWTEVYFNGIGWVSFNPAGGGSSGSDDEDDDGESDESDEGLDDDNNAATEDLEAEETETPESGTTDTPEPTEESEDEDEDEDDEATPPPESEEDEADATPTPDPDDLTATPTPPPDSLTDEDDSNSDSDDSDNDRNLKWLWILLIILAILILLFLLWLWIRRRLAATDPIRLSDQAGEPRQAMMILYRSILTLLAQKGLRVQSTETPTAFARRVTAQTPNPDFVVFAEAVSESAYGKADVSDAAVQLGQNAYTAFEKGLKRRERLRLILTRLLRGLGEFEQIP